MKSTLLLEVVECDPRIQSKRLRTQEVFTLTRLNKFAIGFRIQDRERNMGSTNTRTLNKTRLFSISAYHNATLVDQKQEKVNFITALRAAPPSSKHRVRSWETVFPLPRPINSARQRHALEVIRATGGQGRGSTFLSFYQPPAAHIKTQKDKELRFFTVIPIFFLARYLIEPLQDVGQGVCCDQGGVE